MRIHVDGGTGAGRLRPKREVPREAWTCPAGHPNKGNWTRCFTLGCGATRDARAA